jgi:integrase/recombinase XerD
VERLAGLTVETYNYEMEAFFGFAEKNVLSLETMKAADINAYLAARRSGQRIGQCSAAKALSALRSFFRFVCAAGLRSENPAALLETPERGQKLPRVLSRETVDRVLLSIETAVVTGKVPAGGRQPKAKRFIALRDRALFELVYSSGLRISEVLGLDLKDVFWTERLIRVTGKGSKERLIPFGEEAETWMKKYLAETRQVLAGLKRSNALFLSRNGKRLSRKSIWRNYALIAEANGVGSRVHTLRHSFATELLRGGADLRSVQALLGHADLTTTQVYTHVANSALRENHRKYLPVLDLKTSDGSLDLLKEENCGGHK